MKHGVMRVGIKQAKVVQSLTINKTSCIIQPEMIVVITNILETQEEKPALTGFWKEMLVEKAIFMHCVQATKHISEVQCCTHGTPRCIITCANVIKAILKLAASYSIVWGDNGRFQNVLKWSGCPQSTTAFGSHKPLMSISHLAGAPPIPRAQKKKHLGYFWVKPKWLANNISLQYWYLVNLKRFYQTTKIQETLPNICLWFPHLTFNPSFWGGNGDVLSSFKRPNSWSIIH